MKCAECSNSATRDVGNPKSDANRKAMVRAGFVACVKSFAAATFKPAMTERECKDFEPLDADKAAARRKFFEAGGVRS